MPPKLAPSETNAVLKAFASLECKFSAQNEEISALKQQIQELHSFIKNWKEEGTSKQTCSRCEAATVSKLPRPESSMSATPVLCATGASETEPLRDAAMPLSTSNKPSGCKQPNFVSIVKTRRNKKVNQDAPRNQPLLSEANHDKCDSQPSNSNASHSQPRDLDAQDDWKLVTRNRQRRQRQVVRGSGPASDILSAADRIKYLHVWGARLDTTDKNIVDYLNAKEANNLYSASKLSPKRQVDYLSFKVGVPEHMLNECLGTQFWPKGFSAERWLFRLERTQPEQKHVEQGTS